MRVIAGLARSRHLKTLQGLATRPTADRVKESLFNILGQNLDGATFIDLFAGSGAVGIEALSRGATGCVFVDSSPEACRVIRENLESLDLLGQAEIYCRDVTGAIEIAARKSRSFDYVYCDPPYGKGLALRSLEKLGDAGILVGSGICVIEHCKREPLVTLAGDLQLIRKETYGETLLSFYQTEETTRE